ncbi:DUF4360 domain-containing protein [Actinomadura roseirufa]|uniref:DUF4360 domain-containing protein n=1 Tax=Actinomadura roseirufa TaxID=2094049 RepID=UPI001040EB1F|nr:DUF4360 domain-containing protein [Actinomadura roseirufa]
MRTKVAGFAVVACALAMTAVSVEPAAASMTRFKAGPNGVTIGIAAVNGSGCPPGTVTVDLSNGNRGFTVTYRNYIAQAGGNTDPTDSVKNCLVNVKVHAPQGFTYAVSSVDHRGYASLEPGAEAMQRYSFSFHGASQIREFEHPLSGPYKKNWQLIDTLSVAQFEYKPCDQEPNLDIKTQLRVDPGQDASKVSLISMSSEDGSIKTTYRLTWKTCPQPALEDGHRL